MRDVPSGQRLRYVLASATQGVIIPYVCGAINIGEVNFVKSIVLPSGVATYKGYNSEGSTLRDVNQMAKQG